MNFTSLPLIVFALSLLSLLIIRFAIKDNSQEKQDLYENQFTKKDWIRVGLTLIILVVCLFIILSGNYSEAEQRWAFASIGTILGYWLR